VVRARRLLVIAEVRTRASDAYGGAAASVGRAKQRRIAATAGLLLQRIPSCAAAACASTCWWCARRDRVAQTCV
jgi:Holliday junction resolvase-like predicted endonuclease